jgi:hypothetical protein
MTTNELTNLKAHLEALEKQTITTDFDNLVIAQLQKLIKQIEKIGGNNGVES